MIIIIIAQALIFGLKEIDSIFVTTTLPWPWFHNAYFGDFKRTSHACSMESHDKVIIAVCEWRSKRRGVNVVLLKFAIEPLAWCLRSSG